MLSKFLPSPDGPYGPSTPPRTGHGMSGRLRGMNGTPGWARAYAVTAGLLALAGAVNIATRWHDGRPGLPLWRPVLSETSSITSALAFAWIAFAARDRTRGEGLARAVALHAGAACAFSALHCLGMWTLRRIVLTAAGVPYGWSIGPGQLFYELRKDVVTYAVIALIYQGVRRPVTAAPDTPPPPAAATYTIRDGAKLWRVETRDILAVLSAGNYVEFLLADGRRIMMRATLAGIGAELGEAGFVRVHRSWIVNAARVRALAPDSSGDYTLTLEGGASVPLSRRFPQALTRLRG